jgi:hypothetical protein
MNPPVLEVELWETQDRPLVLWFMVNDVMIQRHERNKRSVGKTVFYFDREEIKPYLKMWQSGESLDTDFRKVMQVETTFNSVVHDEI